MFSILLKLAILTASTTGSANGQAQKPAGYKVSQLAFMAGSWEGKLAGQTIQETWLAPGGGSLLGMMRMDDAAKTNIREFEVIEETPDGITMTIKHFNAKMEEAPGSLLARKLVALEDGKAVFESNGPDPKEKLTYERDGKDGLVGIIEMTRNGKPVTIKIPMKRRVNSLAE